jgi:peroxiredoxin
MLRPALIICFSLFLVSCSGAGEFNKKLSVGNVAPKFSNLINTDEKSFGLDDFKADVLVICFTCNHCPVAVAYEDRILEFTKKYAGKVDFVAINSVLGEEESFDDMKKRAKSKEFNFPYLHDVTQKTGRAYGATVTPEFVVLDKNRKVTYLGALDDNINEPKIKQKYLEDAVDATLKGEPVTVAETRSKGCSIKYEK